MKKYYPFIVAIILCFSSLVWIWAALHVLTTFTTSDRKPELITTSQSDVNTINVSFGIFDFIRFDTRENKFIFDGVLRFDAPALVSQEMIEGFSFERGEIKSKTIIEKTMQNNRAIYHYQVRVDINIPLNYAWYPFDDHALYITLINRKLSTSNYVFSIEKEQFSVIADAATSEWVLHDTTVQAGGVQWLTTKHYEEKDKISPAIVFGIEYLRVGYTGLLSILFPLLILFYISLFIFAIDGRATYEAVAQSSLANIAGLIAYRFVIDTVSPVTSYLKLSDYVFIITLLACLIMTFINLFSPWFKMGDKVRLAVITIMSLIVTGSFIGLLMFVMR